MRIAPISNVSDLSNLRTTINLVIRQVSETTGEVTLSTGASTVVKNARVSAESFVHLKPNNAGGKSADAWVSSTENGTFTITHLTGAAGRVVGFAIIGAV